MNGYKILADSYRKSIEEGKVKKEEVENELKALDMLSNCSNEDIFELVNTGAFNDIIKAYAKKAMNNVGIKDNEISATMDEMRWLFDTVGAKDIVNMNI